MGLDRSLKIKSKFTLIKVSLMLPLTPKSTRAQEALDDHLLFTVKDVS